MTDLILNNEIAELCGAIMGDGHIHTTSNKITITGSLDDVHYYNYTIIPILNKYFHSKVHLKKRKDRNSHYLWIENKETMQFVLKIGLQRGHKSKAYIPSTIKNNKDYILSFLRGLFDTDGCLKFSKQTKPYFYYPRLRLCFQSSPLISNLKEVFDKINFKYSLNYNKRYNTWTFEISGIKNLQIWMKLIGMNNPVHKSKYLFWQKFGKYTPHSSLYDRKKALDLNIIEISQS